MYACMYERMDACMYVYHVCIPCMYIMFVHHVCLTWMVYRGYKYMYMYVPGTSLTFLFEGHFQNTTLGSKTFILSVRAYFAKDSSF